jgi:hypothetical protein
MRRPIPDYVDNGNLPAKPFDEEGITTVVGLPALLPGHTLPRGFLISFLSSTLMPRGVSSQRGAARSALIAAPGGSAMAEPNC